MKKVFNLLGWALVVATIISIILTLLTAYQFITIKYFNTYYPIEWGIFLTMIFWSFKLFDNQYNKKKVYPIICLLMACVAMFFIYMRVY